jgi:hypothetical protein
MQSYNLNESWKGDIISRARNPAEISVVQDHFVAYKSSGNTSATLISKRHWITQHLGFSTEPPRQNGMNVMAVHLFHNFRSDGSRA